ncbi:MAG: hypothetical protein RL065_1678 [Bacteroidota bacterium]|jgi:hypothetical protein
MNNIILIEPQYLPPISFFKMIKNCKGLQIEMYEHYIKSSFRNRCYIPGANGVMTLSIPLEKGKFQPHTAMKDVMICKNSKWQSEHWKAIMYLYKKSPYFEYYEADFKSIFQTEFTYLAELNIEFIKLIIKLLQLNIEISFTTEYQKNILLAIDKRNSIKPNLIFKSDEQFPKYYQVFEDKIGFKPNMSIIDLLFLEGNNAISLL